MRSRSVSIGAGDVGDGNSVGAGISVGDEGMVGLLLLPPVWVTGGTLCVARIWVVGGEVGA